MTQQYLDLLSWKCNQILKVKLKKNLKLVNIKLVTQSNFKSYSTTVVFKIFLDKL